MGDHLNRPSSAQTANATQVNLRKQPEDMPDRGGRLGGEAQTADATKAPLGARTDHPVAIYGAKPGMGETQVGIGTKAPLSRKANSPYDHISKTKPQVDL